MKATTTPSQNGFSLLRRQVVILPMISGLTIAFLKLAADVGRGVSFSWDGSLMLMLHTLSRPWLDQVMLGITRTGGALTVVAFAGLLYWLHRRRERSLFWGAAVSFLGAVSLNGLLKTFFARPRPNVFSPLTVVYTYSFPSGHTVAAISLYGFLAFALWQAGQKWWATLSAMWVLFIALSRVYLGVHYPSDVIGALAFGGIWLLSVIYWLTTSRDRKTI